MRIETERLVITEFTPDMARDVHLNSLDEDNRRFVPDEVFETEEDARETVAFLISQYGGLEGPLAYPVFTKAGRENIGYVQMVPLEDGSWEIGYHIAKPFTGRLPSPWYGSVEQIGTEESWLPKGYGLSAE